MGEVGKIFVAGEWVEGEADVIEDKNPYNGETIALVRRASPRQMERAIDAAAEAFKSYRKMPAYKRADMLLAVSQKVAARQEELARIIALEVAKPIRTARAEVARAVYTFRIASEEARRVGGQYVPMDAVPAGEGRVGYFYRQPVGVVGAITPFNFPLNLVAHKVAPALAAGNTVVVKPTEKAPLIALKLAEIIMSLRNLRLAGIQAYAGHASHVVGFENRRKASREAMEQAVATRHLFESKGIPCPLLSGGSTGTYNIDTEIPGITELQPGSFIFMDVDYNRIGGRDGDFYGDFRNSLTVLTTVISKPAADTAIVDAGLKAFSTDKPFPPECRTRPGVSYSFAGDEHGRLSLSGEARAIELGDRLEFVIPHCDPTVNLYDRIYCLRGEAVEDCWRITARGMSQ